MVQLIGDFYFAVAVLGGGQAATMAGARGFQFYG